MSSDRTHWADCWREPSHHACAVVRVEELQAKYDRALKDLVQASRSPTPEQRKRWVEMVRRQVWSIGTCRDPNCSFCRASTEWAELADYLEGM